MAKKSYLNGVDQYDPKIFRESLSNFGTTTKPGADQLTELQAMVRRGVKHVELHLNSQGKGDFGAKDVPDKYGFEERRTIMQLAKLNNQTLSVHATLGVTSFSGLDTRSGGFDESQRLDALRELDENVKFASETAKGGAIVMHMQGEGISSSRTDLNLSSSYMKWLKNKAKDDIEYQKEYNQLQKNYFGEQKDKLFTDNPITFQKRRQEYENLDEEDKRRFKDDYKDKNNGKTIEEAIKENPSLTEYDAYAQMTTMNNLKTNKDYRSAVIVGNKIQGIDRNKDFVDVEKLQQSQKDRETFFKKNEREALQKQGILFDNSEITGEGLAKAQAIFQNGKPSSVDMEDEVFESLKNKLLVKYEDVYRNHQNSQNQADTDYFKKFSGMQIESFRLQKKDLDNKYRIYDPELKRIDELEQGKRKVYNDMIESQNKSTDGMSKEEIKIKKGKEEALKLKINEIASNITNIKYNMIGQDNYHELAQYNERMLQFNEKIKELKEQTTGAKSVADVTFDRNVSGVGYMGLKALKYQLDLKKKSETAEKDLRELREKIKSTKEEYVKETDYDKQDKLAHEMAKMQRDERKLVGLKDYSDIDIINNPLYIAPENMLPGMGNLCNVEEVKAVIRMSQEDFAKKILDTNNDMYKRIKDDYEKVTGNKITNHDDALKLAKKHVGGTFDSAHAAAWLKHYRYKEGEDEEQRLENFNIWLNTEAEKMVKEGLVKHIHLNDSSGKDDDHNSIGSGILDMHDLRKRLRKAQSEGAELDNSFIIEAGGRGADKLMHMDSAFNLFNPMMTDQSIDGDQRLNLGNSTGAQVSDWMAVKRDYDSRPQYSSYGMNDSTFRHQPPQDGRDKGGWSGTSFF